MTEQSDGTNNANKQTHSFSKDTRADRDNKSFCMMPWVHLHVTQAGMVSPCCMARDNWNDQLALGNIREQTIEEIWNGPAIREFRKKLLRGEPDYRCTGCYESEALGAGSLRLGVNEWFSHKTPWAENTCEDGLSLDSKPIYWDVRFSNVCNLRCRICNPWASSRWHEDAKLLGNTLPHPIPKVIRCVEEFDDLMTQLMPFVGELEAVYFAGGEPLLMDDHYRMLDVFRRHGRTDVRLRYSSNLSTLRFKGQSVCGYWKEFSSVEVAASLDDSYERGELQRKDLQWQQVVENRKEMLRECPHVAFLLAPTISVLNVYHFPDLHREWTEQSLIDVAEISLNMLHSPAEYHVSILPPSMKREVEEKYERHIEWIMQSSTGQSVRRTAVAESFANVIKIMNSKDTSHLIPTFVEKCARLDELRHESTFDVLPELRQLLTYRRVGI